MKQILSFLIRCYQLTISPLIGPCCRFHPSCSNYALEALSKYPFFKACSLIARRILRCSPLHPGGFDPP